MIKWVEKQNLVPGNNTAIYGAIDRSKGEIEVHPDIWLPNQQAYTNDLVPKGTLKLSSQNHMKETKVIVFLNSLRKK